MDVQYRYSVSNLLDWCYGGVNSTIPGNGGPECAEFISFKRKFIETIVGCFISFCYFIWGYAFVTYPTTFPFVRKDRGGKRILLVIVSLVFGIEIGFKLATKQIIYLLNPCHIITAIQIYLLAAPPSLFVSAVFRIHLNFLNGAVLALNFPVTNSRSLPLEVETYWLQHLLILVTPYYLLRLGGVYTVEDIRDFSWTLVSMALQFSYHFLFLQYIGLLTEVNLNNMLCPAISDPFYGPSYRMAALAHQSLCIPLVSKTYCLIADFFITKFGPTKIKDHLQTDVTISLYQTLMSSHDDDHNGVKPSISKPLFSISPTLHRRSKSATIPENKEDN